MPRPSSIMIQHLSAHGCMVPRHPRGCRQNYLRVLAVNLASMGYDPPEILREIDKARAEYSCDCELSRENLPS